MFRRTHTPAYRARKEAERRVRRGVEFLRKHAPQGWQQNMFHVYRTPDGRLGAMRRFNVCHNNDGVLAIAFETAEGICAHDGDIANLYGIGLIDDQIERGFHPTHEISDVLLHEEWEKALTSYAAPTLGSRRHYPHRNWRPPTRRAA